MQQFQSRQGARRNQRASETPPRRKKKKKEEENPQKTKKRSAFGPGFPAPHVKISIPGRGAISRAHAGTRSGTKGARARLGQRRECLQQSTESSEKEEQGLSLSQALSNRNPSRTPCRVPFRSSFRTDVGTVKCGIQAKREAETRGGRRGEPGRHRLVANEKLDVSDGDGDEEKFHRVRLSRAPKRAVVRALLSSQSSRDRDRHEHVAFASVGRGTRRQQSE